MPYTDKDKNRQYQREWIKKRRQTFFEGKTCLFCNSDESLELDHIDRSTKVAHGIWSWSEARRNDEIAKCQVLCRKCHQDKTTKECYPERQHGTVTMYHRGGCRCRPCTDANAAQRRKERAAANDNE